MIELMQQYGVRRCITATSTPESSRAVEGVHEGIEWRLVSGRSCGFHPDFSEKSRKKYGNPYNNLVE